jgi:hypothetical protein
LIKAGYARSIEDAKKMDVRTVVQALAYEDFLIDYEDAYVKLNTKQ